MPRVVRVAKESSPLRPSASRPLILTTRHWPMWLNSKQAAQYVGCRSIKSFYSWRQRHRIVVLNNGTVSRRDLDRALIVPRKRRAMSQKSLRNLRASSLWRKSGVNETDVVFAWRELKSRAWRHARTTSDLDSAPLPRPSRHSECP